MSNNSAYGSEARLTVRGVRSILYVGLMVVLALSCWAGALWVGRFLIHLAK
jgi:hypothetical protein